MEKAGGAGAGWGMGSQCAFFVFSLFSVFSFLVLGIPRHGAGWGLGIPRTKKIKKTHIGIPGPSQLQALGSPAAFLFVFAFL